MRLWCSSYSCLKFVDLWNLRNWVFPFFWDWSVKQNFKKRRLFKTFYLCKSNYFSSNFNESQMFIWFFTRNWTLLLPVPCWVGDSTNPRLSSNISKTVRVNIAFTGTFSIWYYLILETICSDFKEVIISEVVDLILLLLCTFKKIGLYHRCFSNALSVNLTNINPSQSSWSEVASYLW